MFIALHASICLDLPECVCGGRRLIEATYRFYQTFFPEMKSEWRLP